MGRVVVVGSVNVDFVVRAAKLPGPGETVTGGRFARHHGGKGANGAVAAVRLGARVRFVGAVGDDDLGRSALGALRAEGIDVSGVAALPGISTGVALIAVDASGENQIAVASGANAALEADRVGQVLDGSLTDGDVLLLNLEISDEPLMAALSSARGAGARVVLNVAPARPLPAAWLDAGAVLILNEGEAGAVGEKGDPQGIVRPLFDRTGSPVIVTLAARGALLADEAGPRQMPGFDVAAVDSTGAGDTFAGAVAACLAQGAEMDEAVRLAMAAAALSVTVHGAREGMPTLTEVETFLRERGR